MAKYNVSSSVGKAFRLLECIVVNQPITAPEISRKLGFNKTNTYRLLTALCDIGYIYKKEKGYNITFKLLSLGNIAPATKTIKSVAKPEMEKLMNIVHENTYLTALMDDKIFVINSFKFPEHHLMLNPEKTTVFPIYSCSSGKMFLAHMPPKMRKELLDKIEFVQLTKTTLTDIEALDKELEKCKKQGYAVENREFADELISICAPIFGLDDEVLACLSISGPSIRITPDKIDEYIPKVVEAAQKVTKQLRKH